MTGNNFLNTPEHLIGRSDSKNPATTCRGITSAGRPCRRALALSKDQIKSESGLGGVIALVQDDARISDAQFFCWQHKEQADRVAENLERRDPRMARNLKKRTEVLELKHQSSIDTLMQKLNINDAQQEKSRLDHDSSNRPRPLTTRQSDRDRSETRKQGERKAAPSFWRSLCCMIAVDDEDRLEIVRHRTRVSDGKTAVSSSVPRTRPRPSEMTSIPTSSTPTSPSRKGLLPSDIPPHIRATLLNELRKPISPTDEDGYIYIFWLTPTSKQGPDDSTAQSLLHPGNDRHNHARRISDVMTEYSYTDRSTTSSTKTILLKIGRANNVTRRMHEWQRQCGYQLSLVRWYPYLPASTRPSPQPSPTKIPKEQPLYPDLSRHDQQYGETSSTQVVKKVPCVKRVERLIHLEMADQQVKRQCATCGSEHREWFEVAANEQGIRQVDDVIKRWITWSQDNAVRQSI